MTPKQLRAFLAVARCLNFSHAAEELHLSRPALSLAIKELETTLGGSLFQRSTRSVTLTPEGRLFEPMARRILVEIANAAQAMENIFQLRGGAIALAAMPSISSSFLPQLIHQYRQRYPEVHITVHDVVNEQILQMVSEHRVEMGLYFAPDSTDLHFTPFYADRFVAVVPGNSALATFDHLSWSELAEQPFICLQRPSVVRSLIEQALSKRHLALNVAFESHQLSTVGTMVAANLGVSIVPRVCKVGMEALGCHCLELADPIIERTVGLVTLADSPLSTASRTLADSIADAAAQLTLHS